MGNEAERHHRQELAIIAEAARQEAVKKERARIVRVLQEAYGLSEEEAYELIGV